MSESAGATLVNPTYHAESTGDRLLIRMAATFANLDAADADVMTFLQESGAAVDGFATRLLLREAALNAVVHGSRMDPQREVRLSVALAGRGPVLTVEDDGPGFSWRERLVTGTPTDAGGRGLALMRTYAAEMRFNDCGNQIVLRCPLRRGEGGPAMRNSEMTHPEADCAITLLQPTEDIVASRVDAFQREIQAQLDAGHLHLAVDLAGVSAIDSRGLAVFMVNHKRLKVRGGTLTVLTRNENFKHLFHVMRLDEHFAVVESL